MRTPRSVKPLSPVTARLLNTLQGRLDALPDLPVARELVHKQEPDNVAISRVAPLSELPHHFMCQLRVLQEHPYFFEHPNDHVPGLLLIEAARQFGVAVAHLHYGVPMDSAFVLEGVQTRFSSYAELDAPTAIVGEVTQRRERKGELRRMVFSGAFVHGGRTIGTMVGDWRMIDAALMRRLRARAVSSKELN